MSSKMRLHLTQQTKYKQWSHHTGTCNAIMPILQNEAAIELWQKSNDLRQQKPCSLAFHKHAEYIIYALIIWLWNR